MGMIKMLGAATLAAAGGLGADAVEAREVDVQWSVTIGSPFYVPPPVVAYPPVYRVQAPGYYYDHRGYHAPRRWDRDGDGIPNRYDRLYNPRWDRDGDGIPNRYDRYPNGRGWHGGRDGHGWHDGRGGHGGGGDWRGGQGGGRGGHDGRGGRGY